MTDSTDTAYIAIQFKGYATEENGWFDTGCNVDIEALPISDTASEAPPTRASYAPVRRFGAELDREIEGNFSSGGPQTVVRADHRNLTVEKISDAVSGRLFEYLCDGRQLAWVHVVRLSEDGTKQMKVSMQDVQVIDYTFEPTRELGEEVVDATGIWEPYPYRLLRLDHYTLLYLTVKITSYTGQQKAAVSRGWNRGTAKGF